MNNKFSELTLRVITGTVIAVVLIAVSVSGQAIVTRAFGAVLSVSAVYELYMISGLLKKYALYAISELIALVVNFVPLPYFSYYSAVVYTMTLILFLVLMKWLERTDISSPIFIFILSAVVSYFFSTFGYFEKLKNGNIYLMLLFTEICLVDILCYFVGKRFGHRRIFPKLSPKKTLEGYIGGTVISIVLLTCIIMILSANNIVAVKWTAYAFFVVCIAAAALFGDLAMSAVKRKFDVKDFSRILPGHGGILDRFDSLLFALPAAYLYISFIGGFIAGAA